MVCVVVCGVGCYLFVDVVVDVDLVLVVEEFEMVGFIVCGVVVVWCVGVVFGYYCMFVEL